MKSIALVGKPNSGKTSLFNALTGARQRVGNWPGVTVERKSGSYRQGAKEVAVLDLPGLYALEETTEAIDEEIARRYLTDAPEADVIVNIVDVLSIARGLYLTLELLERNYPVVVALNKMDAGARNGRQIDAPQLARILGCPVVPIVAIRQQGIEQLKDAIAAMPADQRKAKRAAQQPAGAFRIPADGQDGQQEARQAIQQRNAEERFQEIDAILQRCLVHRPPRRTITDRIDALALHRYAAFPIFLGIMYLMFLFAINVGTAFIDFFDLTASALFVEAPRLLFMGLGLPDWLTVFLADGVGGGVQLVATFIPVIACLFLALSFLEDSGYMGRVAFIVDRLLRGLGLPGKSFVPLIVGFGCNVPAVMATRTLENEPDRILTTVMAPYMSCGARLTVYALFAAAFFPHNGQNVVFALYLIGIALAVLSAVIVRRRLIKTAPSTFLMELPSYHLPTLKGLAIHTWQRLKGFVLRAGKAIVIVVVTLNLISSIGTDGSIGNENSEKSLLSSIGKTITPVFHPMGIDEDNWPATVGIFAGIFAKEVVVGALDALYSPARDAAPADIGDTLKQAVASIPTNLAALGNVLTDPLGLDIGAVEDAQAAAAEQEVALNTIAAMRALFHGELGAFSYLLFILLYMPCVATIGVIYKEIGGFWAVFSVGWSLVMAYSAAVICYQVGSFGDDPSSAAAWLAFALCLAALGFGALIAWGRRRASRLIPLVQVR